MACIVPNCDPERRSFSLRFPRSPFLYERWRDAIELGSGEPFPEDVDPLQAEICQQHFDEVDEYAEPVIFWNRSTNQEVHLASCGLCLGFDLSERIHRITSEPDEEPLTIGDVPVEELLRTMFNIQLSSEECSRTVCGQCLVRLDMVISVRSQFTEAARSLQRMEIFIREENRLRYRKDRGESKRAEVIQIVTADPLLELTDEAEEVDVKSATKLEEILNDVNISVTGIIEEGIFEHDNLNDDDDDNSDEDYVPEKDEEAMVTEVEVDKPKSRRSRGPPKTVDSLKDPPVKRPVGRPPRKSLQPPKEKILLKGMTERKCYMCVSLFSTAEELFAHMVVHVDRVLTCEVCNEKFPSLTKYNRHLAKHDPVERPEKCDHCELRFSDGLGKRRHEKLKHNVNHQVSMYTHADRRNGKFTCQHCGKQCTSMAFLKEHEDAHAGIKRHECKSCGRLFANKNNLERHYLIHTSEKPYKCEICGRAFRQSPMYKDHLRLHSGETPYSCSGCDMQFSSTTLLRKHKMRFHGAAPIQTKSGLPTPRSTNYCRFCMMSFKRHSQLIIHVERYHADKQIEYFRCGVCEQKFIEKHAFDVHVRNHDKSHQCEFCDKAFSTLNALQMHESVHNGTRGYTCLTCNRSFTHVANLKRHELLHLGIKRHECDFCGKKFAQSNQLHTHRRTHTGEKPYECHKCGKRFADNSTLCKHRKSVCGKTAPPPV